MAAPAALGQLEGFLGNLNLGKYFEVMRDNELKQKRPTVSCGLWRRRQRTKPGSYDPCRRLASTPCSSSRKALAIGTLILFRI